MATIKEKIELEHGTINRFLDKVYPRMKMSRTHFYKLVNNEDVNPTIETLKELSELTGIPMEDILNEYSSRHRVG